MRATTFISKCKTSSGFPKLYDQTLPDSKPSPSDIAAAAAASSFSLDGEARVEMIFICTTEEITKPHCLAGEMTQLLSWLKLAASRFPVGQAPVLLYSRKVRAGSVGSTSLAHCKPHWFDIRTL